MKNKKWFNVWTMMGVALVLGIGVIWLSGSVLAQGPLAQTAQTGTTFTYQGSLEDGSGPVDGACDMQFSLYDAASGGTQAGSTLTKSSVAVGGGLFAVELDFGDQFTGDARYLQIAVRCPAGSGSYTNLNGRVALTAAPYALSLRPGATVEGSDTSNSIVSAVNSSASGTGAGLYGEAKASGAAGVSGWNTAGSDGYGVYGRNTANTGAPYGVYGLASGSNATSYGVYGESSSSAGTGVGGKAPTNGVYGEATNNSGSTWGVYGKSNSASGYGVYSNGNAHVEGQLTWKAITSSVSLPAAAFTPAAGGYAFTNNGHTLVPGDTGSISYLAPVYLPQGATITKFSFYWTDSSNDDGGAFLYRIDLEGSEGQMAYVTTSGGSSGGGGGSSVTSSSSDTSINWPSIDNSLYAYYVWLTLPTDTNGATVDAHGVVIEYTIDQPY